jgi:hypothetical protein
MFKSKKKKKLKKSGQRKATWDENEEEDSDEDRIQGFYFCFNSKKTSNFTGVRGQKLHSVQARLRKTEHAMHEILHQLELIANQAEQFRQPLPKEDDPNQTNENQSNMEKQGTDGGLTGEQTTQMEMRLKELKVFKRKKLFLKLLFFFNRCFRKWSNEIIYCVVGSGNILQLNYRMKRMKW